MRKPKNSGWAAVCCLAFCMCASAETEEKIHKQFNVQPGGTLVVNVDFGAIEVTTNGNNEVAVDVWRRVTRKKKADEEAYLKDRPVRISADDGTITIEARGKNQTGWSWGGKNRNEAKYTIRVPAEFNARLNTAGGSIDVKSLTGNVNANTSGGSLRFAGLHGSLDGRTSGGSIEARDCEGGLKLHTSGGRVEIEGGSGSLDGTTSGGRITVKDFKGPSSVHTSGGGIAISKATGLLEASTSGGSITVSFAALNEPAKLSTSGGSVTVSVPESAGFDLDAETSAGHVSSELPVTVVGKIQRDRLKGQVNGGGKQLYLRSSGGHVEVKKL